MAVAAHASHRLQSLAYLGAWSRTDLLEARLLAELEYEGVTVTSIDELFGDTAARIRDTFGIAAELTRESSQASSGMWTQRESSTDLRPDVLLTRVPALYLLGLDSRLLSLVHRYLRLPVAYHGAAVRCSKVDGGGVGTRLWHQDAEDFHVFRVLVYGHQRPGRRPVRIHPAQLCAALQGFSGGHLRARQRADEPHRAAWPWKLRPGGHRGDRRYRAGLPSRIIADGPRAHRHHDRLFLASAALPAAGDDPLPDGKPGGGTEGGGTTGHACPRVRLATHPGDAVVGAPASARGRTVTAGAARLACPLGTDQA